ncbi:MAG: hypothetical protein AAB036_00875 [Elusimicrobiota bacterium]
MRGFVALLLAAAASPNTARAAFQSDTATTSAQFLSIGAGARAAGMGSARSVCAAGPEAVYWNPAGLASQRSPEIAYSRAELPQSVHHDYMALALPLKWLGGVVGVSLTSLSQASIEKIDNAGVVRGAFSPHSQALAVAYGRNFSGGGTSAPKRTIFRQRWDRFEIEEVVDLAGPDEPLEGLRAGASAKVISETLAERTASSFAFDVGAMYRSHRHAALEIGGAVRNAGGRLRFIEESAPLPLESALGAAYTWNRERGRVLGAGELTVPLYGRPYLKLGAQWEKFVGGGLAVVGRTGFHGRSVPDLGILSGLTVGAGMRLGGFACDLAFQPMGALGQSFHFGLGWRFSRTASRGPA